MSTRTSPLRHLLAIATLGACSPGADEDAASTADAESSPSDGASSSGASTSGSTTMGGAGPSTASDSSPTDPASTSADGTDDTAPDPVGPGGCAGDGEPLTALEQGIAELPADTWWTAADTKLRAVCPPDRSDYMCRSVVGAWSGGAWDPVHRQMLIFGGGHGDSSDNSLYAFDLGTLTWARLTEPSPAEMKDADPLPDGQPASRHTYDGLQYLAGAQRLFAWGGSQWQNGGITNRTWLFDHDAGWHDTGVQPPMSFTYAHATAYDPGTDRVFMHHDYGLHVYEPAANTWTTLQDYGVPPYWPRYSISGDYRGVVDTSRDLLWFIGARLYLVYDLANGVHVTDEWITEGGGEFTNAAAVAGHDEQLIHTGGAAIIEATGPGVDYDPKADALVAWAGGAPWRLDLESKTWIELSADGAPVAAQESGGTYGRWRYVPRVNAFLLVNDVDQDVVFYKHSAACGP